MNIFFIIHNLAFKFYFDRCILFSECEDNFYGDLCKYRCGHCKNGEICDKNNGNCHQGCIPYYQQPKCEGIYKHFLAHLR